MLVLMSQLIKKRNLDATTSVVSLAKPCLPLPKAPRPLHQWQQPTSINNSDADASSTVSTLDLDIAK